MLIFDQHQKFSNYHNEWSGLPLVKSIVFQLYGLAKLDTIRPCIRERKDSEEAYTLRDGTLRFNT